VHDRIILCTWEGEYHRLAHRERVISTDVVWDGGDVLAGFTVPIGTIFAELDRSDDA
jgi:hypothetical protein